MKFLFLLCIPFWIFANQDEGHVLASLEGESETLIEDCVSAITGDLILHEVDHITQEAEPIHITRTYLSRRGWEYEGGWYFMPHVYASFDKEFPFILTILEKNGTKRFFQPFPLPLLPTLKPPKKKEPLKFKLSEISFEEGLTNSAHGIPSARSDMLNYAIDFSIDKKSFKVVTPDNTHRYYARAQYRKDHLRFIYLLKWEKLPNGNLVYYSYDAHDALIEIKTKNSTATQLYSWARFQSSGNQYHIHTSDGKHLSYEYQTYSANNENFRLIIAANGKTFQYDLQQKPQLTSTDEITVEYYQRGINQVGNEYIEISSPYDQRIGRIKRLKISDGNTYRFIYFPEVSGRQGGKTEVIDQEGNKTVVFYSKDLRPTHIKYHSAGEIFKHSKTFHWIGSRLQSKVLFDRHDQPIQAEYYEYDLVGNITKHYSENGKIVEKEMYE